MLTHFIFHDTAPTEIYTLSLHDALPICCAEQRASRSLALMLAADLGEAFNLPGIDPAKEKPAVQASLLELTNFQCGDGGFSFWPGDCNATSPYLTSWVVHEIGRASCRERMQISCGA